MEENEQVMSDEIREEVEWCNIRWFDGADTGKRVLLIGDSITLGYGNVVCEKLKEKQIHTAWLCTSKSIDNPSLRKEIEYAMSEYPVELIHFNNGLHGWHLNETTYADALEKMLVWIKETYPMCKLVFATTTQSVRSEYEHEQIQKRNKNGVNTCREVKKFALIRLQSLTIQPVNFDRWCSLSSWRLSDSWKCGGRVYLPPDRIGAVILRSDSISIVTR